MNNRVVTEPERGSWNIILSRGQGLNTLIKLGPFRIATDAARKRTQFIRIDARLYSREGRENNVVTQTKFNIKFGKSKTNLLN